MLSLVYGIVEGLQFKRQQLSLAKLKVLLDARKDSKSARSVAPAISMRSILWETLRTN